MSLAGNRAAPAPAATLRWGLPDVAIAWIVGLVCALVAVLPLFAIAAGRSDAPVTGLPADLEVSGILASLFGQSVGVIGTLALIGRSKGRGSLTADFGFAMRWQDLGWVPLGVGIAFVAGVVLWPVTELADLDGSAQEVVRQFEHANGVEIPLFAIAVVLIAPVAEEVLFRGALLRGLLRRTSPGWAVFGSALSFALVHVLLDPDTYYYLPAFLALGLVCGWRAVSTRTLSQSIFLHVGFNLLGSILILA